MADQNQDPEYLLGDTKHELARLGQQHQWMQTCQKGRIVYASLDLEQPQLKILDVGCADGASDRLQNM